MASEGQVCFVARINQWNGMDCVSAPGCGFTQAWLGRASTRPSAVDWFDCQIYLKLAAIFPPSTVII